MRYNKNEIGDEIIFDRDTSAPKNKMKNNRRLRRPQQKQEIPNSAPTDKKLNSDKTDEIKNKLEPKLNNLTTNQKKNINSDDNKNKNKNNSNINNNSDINKKGNENDINNNKDKEIEQNNKNKKEEEEKNKKAEEREREREKNENEKYGNINGKNENNNNILNKNAKDSKDNNDNNSINDDNYNNKKGNKKNQNNKGKNGNYNDSSDEENEYSKNKSKQNKQKNKNNINSTSNVDKQDAFIQVNLMNELITEEKNKIAKQYKLKESEYKEKIYNLKEDIENLKDENKQQIINLKNEINTKKEEIIRLTNLNSKLKRNVENMTEKINNLYNKMLEKNKLNSINYNAGTKTNTNANKFRTYNSNFNVKGMNNDDNNENENSNNNNGNGNTDLNEIIKIKDKQIRDSLSMISYLTKEKNKLKEELNNLKDQTKNVNNSAIINKNKLNLLKTTNQKFNLNKPNQNDGANLEIVNGKENGNENGDEAEKNNNINDMDLVNNENDLLQRRIKYGSTIYKNMLLKSKNNKRATSAKNLLEEKKKLQENVHVKMNKLFNDEERKALSTLFKTSEEFDYFNQKINVLHNHNTAIERKLLIKIRSLKIDNDDKDEQIQYLQEKLRECETKLKIMENKYNYEKFLTRQNRKDSNNN